jgi:hypothetical protein
MTTDDQREQLEDRRDKREDRRQKAQVHFVWFMMLMVTLVIGTFAASVIWANRAAGHAEDAGRQAVRESEQAWCAIITSISQGQRENPPTTAAGREFADRIEALRIRFRCE